MRKFVGLRMKNVVGDVRDKKKKKRFVDRKKKKYGVWKDVFNVFGRKLIGDM